MTYQGGNIAGAPTKQYEEGGGPDFEWDMETSNSPPSRVQMAPSVAVTSLWPF
jgi:hypothetical protein